MSTVQNSSPGAHRKLAAIMFTDMVGYSALMQRDEDRAIALLDEQRAILRGIFPAHDGIEIETIGDAFLVEFDSAVSAVRCALAIQDALRLRNAGRFPRERIMVRIGIHLGDIVRRGERVYGDGVNLASRIQEEAGPGEVFVSEDIARQIRNVPEIPLEPAGVRTLKNIDEPMHLYRVGGAPAEARAPSVGREGVATRRKRWMIAGSALAVVGAAALILLLIVPSRSRSVVRNSVAVLPFENLSPDTNFAPYVEGITLDVIREISRIREIRVINPNSVYRIRSDETLGEIARKLDVQTIVQGKVQFLADRVKVHVTLNEPFTGELLWVDSYTGASADLTRLPAEIAEGVAGELRQKLTGGGDDTAHGVSRSYAEAHDLYLQGRFHWNRRTPGEVRKASELFRMAVEKDSTYAPAYVGLADCYSFYGSPEYGVAPPDSTYPEAETAVNRALRLDESLAEAHATLASIRFNYRWDAKSAEHHFRRAIELNPNYAMAYAWYADFLTSQGRFGESRANIDSAVTRDPLNLSVRMSSGVGLYFEGRFDSAIAEFRKIVRLDTAFVPVYLWLGLASAQVDRYDEGIAAIEKGISMAGRSPIFVAGAAYVSARGGNARQARNILDDLRNLSREIYVSPYYYGEIYHALGDDAEAFTWFTRAVEEKSGAIVFMKVSPTLADYRKTPQFHTLLRSADLE